MGRFPKLLTGLFRDFRNSYNEGIEKAETDLNKALGDSGNALTKATTAETISTSVQAQLNQLVIEGDSSPQITQALAGTPYNTLREKHEADAALLAESATDLEVLKEKPSLNIKQFDSLKVAVADGYDYAPVVKKAFEEAKLQNKAVEFPSTSDGEYLDIYSAILVHKGLRVFGSSSVSTKLRYKGPTNTALFEGKVDDWPSSVVFQNLAMYGDGTTKDNGTNHCIYIGDEASTELINNPFVRIENCWIQGFKRGVYLEGYGHTIRDTFVRHCNEGIVYVHPEQVYNSNVFAEYCNTGVTLNPSYKVNKAGHMFHWIGGAIQRNGIGFIARNFYDIRLSTYFELNTINDIILGEADAGGYTKAIHGAILDVYSASHPSDCNIKLEHAQDVEMQLSFYKSQSLTVPHVRADGYSKYLKIKYDLEKITSNNPFELLGNSIKTTVIETKNAKTFTHLDSLSETFKDGSVQYGKKKGSFINSKLSIEYAMEDGNFVVSSNSSSAGFINRNSTTGKDLLRHFPNTNHILLERDYECLQAGSGLILVSADGLKRGRIKLNNDGSLGVTLF